MRASFSERAFAPLPGVPPVPRVRGGKPGSEKAGGVHAFAEAADAIARTPGKLAKVAILAAYLRTLEDPDLAAAARFFTGNPLPANAARSLSVGGRTIAAAAEAIWGVDPAGISAAYRTSGDLATALAASVRPPADLGLFRGRMSPAGVMQLLDEIAGASGKSANARRRILVERLLGSCESVLEATYVIKILTGELRIGLREGLIVDGIASAFESEPADVRRAAAAAGDTGAVALAAKHGTLAEVAVGYGAPIAFMLASPLQYGAGYKELASADWLAEDKYDGVRIQAHKSGDTVRLFSRRLNETTAAWPEIVAALKRIDGDAILDGEIVALRDGGVAPFRTLQTRLQRKDVSDALLAEIPVAYVAFDCLARNERFLIDEPLVQRRLELERFGFGDTGTLRVAPAVRLENAEQPDGLHALFESARRRAHEGLVLKRTDAPYMPGKRGKWWLKLKRELDTLDVVVVAVEWGNGRRAQVLSDYTFAVRSGDGELLVIGKAFSGLTDAEIAEMTAWFLAHRLSEPEAARAYREMELARGEIPVEPAVVAEIAFDIIQRSDLHKSGYSLRFPRIVRLRPDKPASEIDSIESVGAIYAAMLEREAGADRPD